MRTVCEGKKPRRYLLKVSSCFPLWQEIIFLKETWSMLSYRARQHIMTGRRQKRRKSLGKRLTGSIPLKLSAISYIKILLNMWTNKTFFTIMNDTMYIYITLCYLQCAGEAQSICSVFLFLVQVDLHNKKHSRYSTAHGKIYITRNTVGTAQHTVRSTG